MGLEFLQIIRPGGRYHAPTWLVRCSLCGETYARTGTKSNGLRRQGCTACRPGACRPRKPDRTIAEANARYWAANKDAINARRRAARDP